ncbi:hypothetical protein LCGC14_1062890 [marine sediment metagenome]|uniref:Uncharacterized protein n=1 Tax=marine sediment metagenome TaxID=412755 RepID=A0A0F9Q3L5_9ZZZZ
MLFTRGLKGIGGDPTIVNIVALRLPSDMSGAVKATSGIGQKGRIGCNCVLIAIPYMTIKWQGKETTGQKTRVI